jgi:hypothetical protein
MESTTNDGLTVTYNEETLEFTFDWDEITHPEYNFLHELTSEDLVNILTERLKALEAEAQDAE